MSSRDIRVADPVEALLVEQLLAMVRELRDVCQTAPDGHVLEQAEQIAVNRGRELMRKALENVLNEQAKEVEKKGRRRDDAIAAEIARIAGDASDRSSRMGPAGFGKKSPCIFPEPRAYWTSIMHWNT